MRGQQLRCISNWSYRTNVGKVTRKYNYCGSSDFGNEGSKYSMLLWIPHAHTTYIQHISYLDAITSISIKFSLYEFIGLKDICTIAEDSEFLIYNIYKEPTWCNLAVYLLVTAIMHLFMLALYLAACHTPEAATTVSKRYWGWTQKASETCTALLQLLINILPSCMTLVLYIY